MLIRLYLLGRTDLFDADGDRIQEILAQPTSFALLAYLAANGNGPARRESVATLFWPDSDPQQARRNLRKRLHHLRKALGGQVLNGSGEEELTFEPDLFWCDVKDFDQALRAERLDEVLTLYGGTFLNGFRLNGNGEFDRWADVRRVELQNSAAAAARSLRDRHATAGDLVMAAEAARQATKIKPFDEKALQSLIHLLDRVGDRAGALREAERFAERLERELEVEPSPETLELVEAIRERRDPTDEASSRVPQRQIAGDSAATELAPPVHPAPEGRRVVAPRLAIAAILLVLTGWVMFRDQPVAVAGQPGATSVVMGEVVAASPEALAFADDLRARMLSAARGSGLPLISSEWNRMAPNGPALSDRLTEGPEAVRRSIAGNGLILIARVAADERESMAAEVHLVDIGSGHVRRSFNVDGTSEEALGKEVVDRLLGALRLETDDALGLAPLIEGAPRASALDVLVRAVLKHDRHRWLGPEDDARGRADARAMMDSAWAADPSFYLARLRRADVARDVVADTMLDPLSDAPLSEAERLYYAYLRNRIEGDLGSLAADGWRLMDLAPRLFSAHVVAIEEQLSHYGHVVEAWRRAEGAGALGLREDRFSVAVALHMLGRHAEELEALDRSSVRDSQHNTRYFALAALGDVDALIQLVANRDPDRGQRSAAVLIGSLPGHMERHGHTAAAERFRDEVLRPRLARYGEERNATGMPLPWVPGAYLAMGDWEAAGEVLGDQYEARVALAEGQTPGGRSWDHRPDRPPLPPEIVARLGWAAAAQGDDVGARRWLGVLDEFPWAAMESDLLHARAVVHAWLGETDAAVALIEDAIVRGLERADLHYSAADELAPIADDPLLRALIHPPVEAHAGFPR